MTPDVEVRAYVPDDFLIIVPQPMQNDGQQSIEVAHNLLASTESFTATVDGEVMACIGLIQFWPGRRLVWAYLAHNAGPHMLRLTRLVQRWLKYHGQGRIEAAIDPEFPASIRWAHRLGFQREGRMLQYVPGKDYDLYARIGR